MDPKDADKSKAPPVPPVADKSQGPVDPRNVAAQATGAPRTSIESVTAPTKDLLASTLDQERTEQRKRGVDPKAESAAPPTGAYEFTAPVGGVVAGRAYWIDRRLAIASSTAGAGDTFKGLSGTVEYAKVHEEEWVAGDPIYWSVEGACFTHVDPGGENKVGEAAQDAKRPSVNGVVRLSEPEPKKP